MMNEHDDYYELKCKAIKYDNLMNYLDKVENTYQKAVNENPGHEPFKQMLELIKLIKL